MIDMEDHPRTTGPPPSAEIRHGVRQLARDVVTLAELQTDLLNVELRDWLRSSAAPTLLLSVAAVGFAAASMPLLLLSLAYYLRNSAGLSTAAAMLSASGAGLLVAGICGAAAWRFGHRSASAFARTRVELARNVRWLKQVLSHPAATADDFVTETGPSRPR
jgi:uncharacterized membrane protein YqjE